MPDTFPAPGPSDPINLGPPTAEDYAEAGETPDYDDGLGHEVPGGPVTGLSDVLSRLRAAPVKSETRAWDVRTRPGFSVRFSLGVDPEVVRKAAVGAAPPSARRRSGGPRPEEINETRFLAVVLARYNTAILADGNELRDDRDEPLTFRADEIRGLYGMRSAADTVQAFYGDEGEGVLINHGRALLRESGVAAEDPTLASDDYDSDPTGAI